MTIKKVVKSQTEPSTSCIWVKDNSLYQHINGKWTKFGQAQEDQLNDLQTETNLHNEFFWAYYKAHPEEIVNLPEEVIKEYCQVHPEHIVKLPTETIYKLFPDILAIIEPLDGAIVIPVYRWVVDELYPDGGYYWRGPAVIQAKNGIITKDQIKEPVFPPDEDPNKYVLDSGIFPYNWSAIRYCNMTVYGSHITIVPVGTNGWNQITPQKNVKVIEGLTGWKNIFAARAFYNWMDTSESYSSERNIYIDEKLTINGDFWLLDKNTEQPQHYFGGSTTLTCAFRQGLGLRRAYELEFNGTIYLETVEFEGLIMFENNRCYQYPTIDISRNKYTGYFEREEGQLLINMFTHSQDFTWIPNRPQKCLIKGMGYTIVGEPTADLWGIIDWDYDDMIASLITYAYNNAENPSPGGTVNFIISQTSFNKLTDDDKAAIVAMGNSVSAKA